jgi:hypothetical protein
LTLELNNYWDDSLKARNVTKFGFINVTKNPPLYDTLNVDRSKRFMLAYLNAQGYYYSSVEQVLPVKIDTVKDQLRTTVAFNIQPGKNIKIDSVAYAFVDTTHQTLKDSLLQNIAMQQFKNTYLKKEVPIPNKKFLMSWIDWFRGLDKMVITNLPENIFMLW